MPTQKRLIVSHVLGLLAGHFPVELPNAGPFLVGMKLKVLVLLYAVVGADLSWGSEGLQRLSDPQLTGWGQKASP